MRSAGGVAVVPIRGSDRPAPALSANPTSSRRTSTRPSTSYPPRTGQDVVFHRWRRVRPLAVDGLTPPIDEHESPLRAWNSARLPAATRQILAEAVGLAQAAEVVKTTTARYAMVAPKPVAFSVRSPGRGTSAITCVLGSSDSGSISLRLSPRRYGARAGAV
jgi:hypothetical protein